MEKRDNNSQKVSFLNWFILGFIYIVDIILLIILLSIQLNISIYNNKFKFIKIITICCLLDILYIFYINSSKFKIPSNILKIYTVDANFKIKNRFIILQIIKIIFIICFVTPIYNNTAELLNVFFIEILVAVIYHIIFTLLNSKENLKCKINRLKRDSKRGKTKLNFILINGDFPDSFNIFENRYNINKNNFYINIENFNKLRNIYSVNKKNTIKFIEENIRAVIHIVKNENELENVVNKLKIENVCMYEVIALKNLKDKNSLDKLNINRNFQTCELNSCIEYIENIFSIPADRKISKIELFRAIWWKIFIKYKVAYNKLMFVNGEVLTNKEYKRLLNLIYQNNFNNRFYKFKNLNVPKDKYLLELYRSAYVNNSPYVSTLILFDYIKLMSKYLQYYLYSANTKSTFKKDFLNKEALKDNPSDFLNQIMVNIYDDEYDEDNKNIDFFDDLKTKRFPINKDEKSLLNFYLAQILNINIEGDSLTYNSLIDLFVDFRNKVEAHGIINDENVYAVWNLAILFVEQLNKMFLIGEMNTEYLEDGTVEVIYRNVRANLGKYIICENDDIYMAKNEEILYISPITGNKIIKKHTSKKY